jgi:hypothetical protein
MVWLPPASLIFQDRLLSHVGLIPALPPGTLGLVCGPSLF